MKKAFILLFLFLGACAHSVHQVHTSDFTPGVKIESGEMVKSSSEQFVILGITGNTSYVEEAYQKLLATCPSGVITGITTQYSTSLSFFSWTNKILMQGLCIQSKAKTS